MKLTNEIKEKILELSNNYSNKEIGKIYNIAPLTVSNLLKANGIKHKKSRLKSMSNISLDENYFQIIDSKEKAYWLGYICADGCIHKNCNKVSLISKDIEVIEKFKFAIKSEHKLQDLHRYDKRTKKWYRAFSIHIGVEIFQKHLINLGITSNKTDKLEMPNIEEKYYPYFFAGLFDGDGSVQEYTKLNKEKQQIHSIGAPLKMNKCRISLISTLEVLNFLSLYLMKTQNIECLKMSKVSKKKANVWKMYLYKDAKKFLDWIYQDPTFSYSTRKYETYLRILFF